MPKIVKVKVAYCDCVLGQWRKALDERGPRTDGLIDPKPLLHCFACNSSGYAGRQRVRKSK